MSDPDLLAALTPVLRALADLGVRHFVGGSIASSAHGVARASVDGDVVAELAPTHVAPLVAALSAAYYVPDERVRDAVVRKASFNVIHLDTMVKIDVFVSRDYLRQGGAELGVGDLVERALHEGDLADELEPDGRERD